MATSGSKKTCIKCDKTKSTVRCGGCLQEFCFQHFADHRQELNQQFDKLTNDYDSCRQLLTEQTCDVKNHPSMKQIDEWEQESIEKIHRKAEDMRLSLIKRITNNVEQIEVKLDKLTKQIKAIRDEQDFDETHLHQFENEVAQLTAELTIPYKITIDDNYLSFTTDISTNTSGNDFSDSKENL